MPRGSDVMGPPPSPTPQGDEGEPAVFLNRADTMVLSRARECQFDAISSLFEAVESSKFISGFADGISSATVKDLLETQSHNVNKLYKFIRSKHFQGKVWSQIAMNWPPVIPDNPQVIDLYYLLVRIIDQVTTQRKFFQWFVKGVFPTIWNIKRQSCNNPIISAISKCTVEGHQGSEYWAILKRENKFILINMEGGNRKVICESEITDIAELNSGIAVAKRGRVIATFFPTVDTHSKKWLTVLNKDSLYNTWLNCGEGPYPEEFPVSLYHGMMVSDMYLTRSLIISNDSKGSELQEKLLDIYSYGCRVTMLFQTVLIAEYEKTNFSFSAFLDPKSNFIKMVDVILKRNGKKYVECVIKKAADYVTNKFRETDGVIDTIEGEIPFFTVLKLIYTSASYFSPEIRHMLSIICSYSIIRINDRTKVFKIFSTVIGNRFIIKELKTKIKSKQLASSFSYLLKKALNFKKLDHPYEEWNRRLRRHTFPALERFYMETAEFRGEFCFEAPPREKVMEDLCSILESLQKPSHWAKFIKTFEQIAGCAVHTGSILSWNFSVALSQAYDLMSDRMMLDEATERVLLSETDNRDSQGEVHAHAGKFDVIEKDSRLMDVLKKPPAEKAAIEPIPEGSLPPLFTMAYPGDFPVFFKGVEVTAPTSDDPIPVTRKNETQAKPEGPSRPKRAPTPTKEIPKIIDEPPPIPSVPKLSNPPPIPAAPPVGKPPPVPDLPTDALAKLPPLPNGLMLDAPDAAPSPKSSRRGSRRSSALSLTDLPSDEAASPRSSKRASRKSSTNSLTDLPSDDMNSSEGKKSGAKRRRKVSKKSSSTIENSDDVSSEEASSQGNRKSPRIKIKKKVVRKKSKSK